jgi:hypothetical protein
LNSGLAPRLRKAVRACKSSKIKGDKNGFCCPLTPSRERSLIEGSISKKKIKAGGRRADILDYHQVFSREPEIVGRPPVELLFEA